MNVFRITTFALDDARQTASFCYENRRWRRTTTNTQLAETLHFPIAIPDKPAALTLLRALHIALSISYYKTFVPEQISHSYAMPPEEADFWNTVFTQGLGEFMFVNSLPSEKLVIPCPNRYRDAAKKR